VLVAGDPYNPAWRIRQNRGLDTENEAELAPSLHNEGVKVKDSAVAHERVDWPRPTLVSCVRHTVQCDPHNAGLTQAHGPPLAPRFCDRRNQLFLRLTLLPSYRRP